MLDVHIENDIIYIGKSFQVVLQRTLRIPDDGKTYPLPPGMGRFPICRVEDYQDRVPASWKEHGGVFIPMYQREALWLRFGSDCWPPRAVKVAVGQVNAITGTPWDQQLHADPQDYLVCPTQPWLDGINAGEGYIRQFVAMPLGMGYTVEAQVTGKEEFGGIQLMVFDPKPGKFPEHPPWLLPDGSPRIFSRSTSSRAEMSLAAGGKIKQKIYPDPHGMDSWDQHTFGRLYVHIVNSMAFREITGLEPPPTPVSAKTYTIWELPWYDLYDEDQGDLEASDTLKELKSVKETDLEKGLQPQQDDDSIDVPDEQIRKLGKDPDQVQDGEW
jgi:hypothetical protein